MCRNNFCDIYRCYMYFDASFFKGAYQMGANIYPKWELSRLLIMYSTYMFNIQYLYISIFVKISTNVWKLFGYCGQSRPIVGKMILIKIHFSRLFPAASPNFFKHHWCPQLVAREFSNKFIFFIICIFGIIWAVLCLLGVRGHFQ